MNHAIALTTFATLFTSACSRDSSDAKPRSTSQSATTSASTAASPPATIATPKEDWIALRIANTRTSIRALMPHGENAHAPAIVMLGGICAHAGWVCASAFEHAGNGHAFLCPQPTGYCSDGTPTWIPIVGGNDAFIDATVETAEKMYPNAFNFDDAILAGFSRGGWIAAQYAMAHRKYRKLLLSSIEVALDAKKLRDNGVERVLLTANVHDGSRFALQSTAAKLNAAGLPARFFGTGGGNDAHAFEPTEAWWNEAYRWFSGEQTEGNPAVPPLVSR